MSWDPARYDLFADERSRPFHDLVSRIGATAPRRVVDLGCGSGRLTATLRRRWPDAVIEGIDSSASMIAAADPGGVAVQLGDIATWQPPAEADVVLSNAALQWVPDHVGLLRSWCAALPAGAWLAWQVPGNFGSPSHTLMRSLASSARWSSHLGDVLRHHDSIASPAAYARLLLDAGWSADVWETTYQHVLTGPDPVLAWVRGTGLRPVLDALSEADAAEFEVEYAGALRSAYPAANGVTIFAFRRIFCVGHKP